MKPPFSYYGAKVKLASRIVALMPEHHVYCEPYAGSLAVLLAKPRAAHEVVNDLDGDVVNFWRQLRERPGELERVCRLTPYSREEFAAAGDHLASIRLVPDDLERARCWWTRVSQSYAKAGAAGSGWSTGATRSSARAATTLAFCDRMDAVARRLRTVAIECRDACEVVATHDGPDTVHYLDPPYLGSARRDADNHTYTTEMVDEASHRRLAAVLAGCRGTVLLSGYASPLYEDLYAGWERVEWDVHLASANRTASSHRAVEVLWSNRPLRQQAQLAWTGVSA